jgi:ribosomal subunit interface protein
MNITVKGKGVDVGDALRSHITNTLANHLQRYFDRSLEAQAVVGKDGGEFAIDLSLHVPGEVLAASGAGADAYDAYAQAEEKLIAQVKKHKSRVRDHHKDENPSKAISA